MSTIPAGTRVKLRYRSGYPSGVWFGTAIPRADMPDDDKRVPVKLDDTDEATLYDDSVLIEPADLTLRYNARVKCEDRKGWVVAMDDTHVTFETRTVVDYDNDGCDDDGRTILRPIYARYRVPREAVMVLG